MKKLTIALALLLATTALADPVRRTLIIKDGKIITDTNEIEGFDPGDLLLSGPRAYLGVSLMNISPELREHFGAPKEAGVMVESVADDSPADRAGVKVGDIILSVEGKDVAWSGDIRKGLRDKKEGDTVRIEVLRGRARQSIVATVKEREQPRLLHLDELPSMVGSPEFRARISRMGGDCADLQSRIHELETRLKDLEKKLQK
jgi:hypothetical protein